MNGETGIITKTTYGYLPAPVESVGISAEVPTKVLITHRAGAATKSYPVSIIDLEEEIVNPIYLDAPPTSLIITPAVNGSVYAFMTLKNTRRISYYNLSTGDTDGIKIGAVPFTAGLMKDMLFILHDQPLGTITFLNLENFEITEIKGVTISAIQASESLTLALIISRQTTTLMSSILRHHIDFMTTSLYLLTICMAMKGHQAQ